MTKSADQILASVKRFCQTAQCTLWAELQIRETRAFPTSLYKRRVHIEQTMGELKRFERIALRCGKTAQENAPFVAFTCDLVMLC